jgi:hypothetical protein
MHARGARRSCGLPRGQGGVERGQPVMVCLPQQPVSLVHHLHACMFRTVYNGRPA